MNKTKTLSGFALTALAAISGSGEAAEETAAAMSDADIIKSAMTAAPAKVSIPRMRDLILPCSTSCGRARRIST